ncbi:hypothetical protein KFE25_008943 [Diacronema lutheri]|uniref:Uncharacterized protein n=1 Tax=Diacronema lutheri TaxID=2081491 RepID=A0A8J5XXT4_DIALT|nr:hypothetical protein KFE25_008943 [Diacronema lutheri]
MFLHPRAKTWWWRALGSKDGDPRTRSSTCSVGPTCTRVRRDQQSRASRSGARCKLIGLSAHRATARRLAVP